MGNLRLVCNAMLKAAIRKSLEEIRGSISDVEVRAYAEQCAENEFRVVIEVTAEYDTVDRYKRIKKVVRDIVRKNEKGKMIYTRIRRKA